MRSDLPRRLAALAAIALLAALGALAVGASTDDVASRAEPDAVPAGAQWYEAVAVLAPRRGRTSCAVEVRAGTVGVAHPVLPCRARIVVRRGQTTVETAVIDRLRSSSEERIGVSPALARVLAVRGGGAVSWAFAAR